MRCPTSWVLEKMSSFPPPEIGVWLYLSQVNGLVLSLPNSNTLGTSLETTEHHSMLDFALRSFNGLTYTARKSRCSLLRTWGGCRGHAILINKAPSPCLSWNRLTLFQTGGWGQRVRQYLDYFISLGNVCLQTKERHEWTLRYGWSLKTTGKFLKYLEGQILALAWSVLTYTDPNIAFLKKKRAIICIPFVHLKNMLGTHWADRYEKLWIFCSIIKHVFFSWPF